MLCPVTPAKRAAESNVPNTKINGVSNEDMELGVGQIKSFLVDPDQAATCNGK